MSYVFTCMHCIAFILVICLGICGACIAIYRQANCRRVTEPEKKRERHSQTKQILRNKNSDCNQNYNCFMLPCLLSRSLYLSAKHNIVVFVWTKCHSSKSEINLLRKSGQQTLNFILLARTVKKNFLFYISINKTRITSQ